MNGDRCRRRRGRPRGLWVSLVVAPLCALAAGTARTQPGEPAAGAPRAEKPRLLFTRSMAGTYLKTPDEEKLVSYSQGDTICPRLLPGADRVLLNSMRGGQPGVWLQDLEGSRPERVCDGDQVCPSPDGRQIVLRRAGAVVERDLTSGAEKTISPAGWTACSHPSYGPNGGVLFVSPEAGRDRIYLAGAGAPGLLVEGEVQSAPRSSPDGRTIAYQNGAHLWLLDVASRRTRRLTFAGGVQSWPLWSRDGKSIAYVQSAGPVGGPWQLCSVSCGNPRRVSFVAADVGPGPDWNGLGFAGRMPTDLPGDAVSLWSRQGASSGPIPVGSDAKGKSGWAGIPAAGGTATRDVLVECEWGGCAFLPAEGKVRLLARDGEALAPQAEITLSDAEGKPVRAFDSVRVLRPGGDTVTVAAVGSGATFVISRTRPFVKVAPNRALNLAIRRPLSRVVVPDRLAGDLLLGPEDGDGPTLALPRAAFVLGMPADRNGMLMVAAPSGQPAMSARGDRRAGTFSEVVVSRAAAPVIVAALPGDDLWRTPTIKAPGDGKGVAFTWPCSMAAQWRLAARDGAFTAAAMVPMESPARENVVTMDGLAAPPRLAFVYAYGRTRNTPPERWTPLDILQDALGLSATATLLDVEGVRGCRHAERPVPYKDPRAALKMLGWVRVRTRPGAQQRIDDVCGDIAATLQGLDARVAEYVAFAGAVDRYCRQQGVAVEQRLATVRAEVGRQALTPVSQAAGKLDAFRKGQGSLDACSSAVLAALAERQKVLAAYRALAKGLRQDAGLALVRDATARGQWERVRELAGEVLRRRYYLEADWCGEDPLGGPEVLYETVADL